MMDGGGACGRSGLATRRAVSPAAVEKAGGSIIIAGVSWSIGVSPASHLGATPGPGTIISVAGSGRRLLRKQSEERPLTVLAGREKCSPFGRAVAAH